LKGTGFEREEVRRRPLRLSRGLRSVSRMTGRACAPPYRTPARFGGCVMTVSVARASSALLAWADSAHGLAALDASPVLRVVRRRRHAFTCASASAPATAAVPPKQSATAALRADPSRPARSGDSSPDRAPLLRFGPLQHAPAASRARCPKAARPSVDPASTFSPPTARADREPRPASLALAVLRLSA